MLLYFFTIETQLTSIEIVRPTTVICKAGLSNPRPEKYFGAVQKDILIGKVALKLKINLKKRQHHLFNPSMC